jgi:hypothetical protein
MNDLKNFKLIDGTFEPKEALRVLNGVINAKINYHNLDSFSNHIRFDDAISNSKKRIDQLENTLVDVKEIIDFAERKGIKLKINSTINVDFVP